MEKGNEGDEIILFALRQIECAIPEDVKTISQLTPESIVEIVARSLWLISNGDIKFAVALPPNIAARHRICTNIAAKIKELGYSGDCGYNQLLYPVEHQTRSLINWLVQRLPRADDERAEDVLGVNALLNKHMMESLLKWKNSSWRLHFCTSHNGKPLYNHPRQTFKTVQTSSTRETFQRCEERHISSVPSVLENLSLNVLRDITFASRLENDLDADEASNDTARNLSRLALGAAMRASNANKGKNKLPGESGAGPVKSLQELIGSIDKEATDMGGAEKSGRGTRFTHAAAFAHEENATSLIGSAERDASSKGTDSTAAGVHDAQGTTTKSGAQSSAEAVASAAVARKAKQEADDRARQEELENLKHQINELEASVEDFQRNQNNAVSKIRQLENEVASLQQESEKFEHDIMVKQKTLEMLPSAAENIGKLQAVCGNSAKRLMQLAQEWEQHRRPLVEKIRDLKSSKTKRRNKCKLMVEDMKRCREDMISMAQDLKEKQERSQVLSEELGKLPRNINRTLYTYRIMDIIASIGKQNKEIDKIVQDIREVQKSINSITNTLQRADAIAEEKIYGAANSHGADSATIDAYRNLTTLRAKFEELVTTINNIGQIEKQSRDLETKVDQEIARVSANNFDRIRSDLEQVRSENAKLVSQLRSRS